MVYFQTKNPDLGNFWRPTEWKMFVKSNAVRGIVRSFGNLVVIFYISYQFGIYVPIWYISTSFGILYHGKSGNPDVVQPGPGPMLRPVPCGVVLLHDSNVKIKQGASTVSASLLWQLF
jgi:hypothetical protein